MIVRALARTLRERNERLERIQLSLSAPPWVCAFGRENFKEEKPLRLGASPLQTARPSGVLPRHLELGGKPNACEKFHKLRLRLLVTFA